MDEETVSKDTFTQEYNSQPDLSLRQNLFLLQEPFYLSKGLEHPPYRL